MLYWVKYKNAPKTKQMVNGLTREDAKMRSSHPLNHVDELRAKALSPQEVMIATEQNCLPGMRGYLGYDTSLASGYRYAKGNSNYLDCNLAWDRKRLGLWNRGLRVPMMIEFPISTPDMLMLLKWLER